MRDIEDLCGDEEWSSHAMWRSTRLMRHEKKSSGADRAAMLLGLAAAVIVMMFLLSSSHSTQGGNRVSAGLNTGNAARRSFMSRLLGGILPGGPSAALHTDFHGRREDWISERGERAWGFGDGYARPAGLRLWRQSTSLSDYEFDFVGQIQRHGMSWVFRAPDAQNYYASKLAIEGAGDQPHTGLVRFVVLGGRECDRVELPLPLTLSRGIDYHVHLNVRGSRFLTSINGQLVSSWTDSRLHMGGVGFFSEGGDAAAVKWASVTERDSTLGRLASYFSLLSFPGAAPSL